MTCAANQMASAMACRRFAAVTVVALLTGCADSTGPGQASGAAIRIIPAWVDAFGDEPVTLTVDVRDRGDSPVSGAKVIWTSLDPDIVVVDSRGTIRGVSTGQAYVTATLSNGSTDSAIVSVTGFSAVTAGATQSCGIVPDGSDLPGAWCWGDNSHGQLGDGSTASASSPVRVRTTLRFASISTGRRRTCALTQDGFAHCWGDSGLMPTPVPGLNRLSALWSGVETCGVDQIQVVFCWGPDLNWRIDINPVLNFSVGDSRRCWVTPSREAYCRGPSVVGDTIVGFVSTPRLISAGQSLARIFTGTTLTCALTTQGAAMCWRFGQSGPGPVEVAGGLRFTSLDVEGATACGTTTTLETYCWGANESGQLGNGSTTDSYQPSRVKGGLAFRSVSVGARHACGLTRSGSIYCWGANDLGQLGDGNTTPSLVPVRVVRPQ